MEKKTNKDIDELMYEKCAAWLGDSADKDHTSLMHAEDDGTYHQRIYLMAWSDDDGYAHIYVIRVFTNNDGKTIDLSEDYENCVRNDKFIDVLPSVIQKINELKA